MPSSPGEIDLQALRGFRQFGVGLGPSLRRRELAQCLRLRCDRLRALASERGIATSPECRAQGIEAERVRLNLATPADTRAFLHELGIDEHRLALLLEGEWLHATVKRALASPAAVQRIFTARRALFETVEAVGLPFDEESAARALLEQLRAGRTRFPVAVPSIPQVVRQPVTQGYLGLVTRADLPAEVAEALFSDRAQGFVGPVAYDRRYWVYQLLLPKRPEFNRLVYECCEDLLVEEALDARDQGSSGGT
jgi:hypothetical protein